MSDLFISHSSVDDGFVRELQQALGDLGVSAWIDSRELLPGGLLAPDIMKAIDEASAYAVVVSPASFQSKWVGKELRHALAVQKQRGTDKFPVIPLSLDETKLGVLEEYFEAEPLYIELSGVAGGVDAAMNALLVAMGKRLPSDPSITSQPKPQPLEELVLELTDLKFHEQDGVRRASARARLVYEPAATGQREVTSAQSWRFIAPLGPIESEELRWYLEKFAIWPSEIFRDRARKVEQRLVEWGRLLYEAALPTAHTANVLKAWAHVADAAGRRFSVHVDSASEAGTPDAEQATAREAATSLLGLPWELLHDGDGFLFQGAQPTQVRRRLPNTRDLAVPVMSTPIRILLVTARPEDDACGYIDHRSSALPLVEAMEELGGLVRIHVLSPPTLPALREELDRARRVGEVYHVVHFDGHGVYDRQVGLGGLCFENPQDIEKLERRRHITVTTNELGPLLRDHRIPLIFLEACQTAQAEKASESVASELLKVGVASVVAMSHSVLVETARRFVEAFYDALARGARVGDAMLEGQRRLKDDTFRGRVFGAGELRLEDWFVPVLFQEKEDPQLFHATPAKQTQHDFQKALDARLGELPKTPETGFIGRSRDLLALQRLLRHERYAAVRGQGGEGKTALAAEFARWMVRSHQVRRAVFVSVETHSNHLAVLDAMGRQLVGESYSAVAFDNLEKAVLPVERALIEQSTLMVVDNMESILLPPYVETPEALSEEARRDLDQILTLCARLLKAGETKLIFTSREALPAPFDVERNRRELHRLDRDDAVKLVERVLNAEGGEGAGLDAARESIEELVDAVHGHARTLALLAPSLRIRGVDATRQTLVELMSMMEAKFPGSREHSLFASVELSLRRMSIASREKARVLGVFFSAVDLDMLKMMTNWEKDDVIALASELIETGLATPDRFNHLTLNPALCPYLRVQIGDAELNTLRARWGEAMHGFVQFLGQEARRNAEMAATLTVLELPNLFALLDQTQRAADAEATIRLATSLFGLLIHAGKPRLLEHLAQASDAAAAALGESSWNHAGFEAHRIRIEQQLRDGHLREAVAGAEALLQRARDAGQDAYEEADYDLAMAYVQLAQALEDTGGAEQALPLLAQAQERFEAMLQKGPDQAAARMAAVCCGRRGGCLLDLGRLSDAAAAYEERIKRGVQLGDERGVAFAKGQLGTVRANERRYPEALAAYAEAREIFTRLNEPGSLAVAWHQTGIVYQDAGEMEAAEDAYRKSLAIEVRLGNVAGQASTLNQLGNLYDMLGRFEEAATFYRQSVDKSVEIRDVAKEGMRRSNLADTLRKLRRFDQARDELYRAIACKKQFGHVTESWKTWAILAQIEIADGNPAAASEARREAISCHLAYRRAGGENHGEAGRLCFEVTRLLPIDTAAAASLLQEETANPAAAGLSPFIKALQAIVAGSRDRTLADAPDLSYTMSSEILFLLETLQKAGK